MSNKTHLDKGLVYEPRVDKGDRDISRQVKSPLRYPGAKKKVLDRFKPFWHFLHQEYRDVFVGGGSTFFGKVPVATANWINDKDHEVAQLYRAMRDHPEELCDLVLRERPTVKRWSEIRQTEYTGVVDKGFRTLFLNRTSFSGILSGNPIGGMKQKSEYPIHCRWNPPVLCEQIRRCSERLQGVRITDVDFEDVITAPGEGVLLYLDPPYYHKGNLLYREGMTEADHVRLRDCLRETRHRFFLTYDDCDEVKALYRGDWARPYPAEWFYSSSNKKEREVGQELFISNFDIDREVAAEVSKRVRPKKGVNQANLLEDLQQDPE